MTVVEYRTRSPNWDKDILDPILTRLIIEEKRTDRQAGRILGFDNGIIRNHRNRLRLPVNSEPRKRQTSEGPSAMPKEKPNPIAIATSVLDGFDPLLFRLNGRPINLSEVMKRTNSILKGRGEPQLGPDHWRVP